MHEARVRPGGRVYIDTVPDAAPGATGYNYVVPAGRMYEPLSATYDWTASADNGNRLIRVRILRANLYPYWIGPLSAATASPLVCGYDVQFGNGQNSTVPRYNMADTAATAIQVTAVCPRLLLSPGDTINIRDTANISAVNDRIRGLLSFIAYDL